MGVGSSAPKPQPIMEHHQPYPDMNVIFKGIPKMMQVADDMHRMTNYMMDLRNITVGMVALSIIGGIIFLIMKISQSRKMAARHKGDYGARFECLDDRSLPGHRNQYGTYHGYPEFWNAHRSKSSTAIDMDKVNLNNVSATPNEIADLQQPDAVHNIISDGRLANGHVHKKSEQSIKLLVEDLPYADSS
ncbi:hypothetical protein AB6A40_000935 [Gnathostoma spinigerum]|uniref:Uncharacterized protein n=1 Tax=Gnathostoma spinigerum TaxID=75299 RepID=A0ABD6E4C2_9BILA